MVCRFFLVILTVFLFNTRLFSQSAWDTWDSVYRQVNVKTLLQKERKYSLAIDTSHAGNKYYYHMELIRFFAEYKKNKRLASEETLKSAKRVYNLYGGDPSLINLMEYEVLMEVNGEPIWMLAQKEIIKELNRKTRKIPNVYLYCRYLNEYTVGKLYDNFIISEFKPIYVKDREKKKNQ
jgi:hypothetical protein